MSIFEADDFDDHEMVAVCSDKKSGLRSIIAIHSTALGPSLGGTRMYPYASFDVALKDVLRISRAMSYKNAMAGLPLGGGKAVIIGNPERDKSETLLLAHGSRVDALSGRYITAADLGMMPADMATIARTTRHVVGYQQHGKSGGDTGPVTALGVLVGLKAAVKHRLGAHDLKGLTVAIQGLGNVGMALAQHLHDEGARLLVADVNRAAVQTAVRTLGAQSTSPEDIVTAECDVLSPNALGAVLDDRTVPRIRARVIAGAANNQLAKRYLGHELLSRKILFAPDYVISAGGVTCACAQLLGWSDAEIERRVREIARTAEAIFLRSDREGLPTDVIADRMAQERIAGGRVA